MKDLRVSLILAMIAIALLSSCQSNERGIKANEVWAKPGIKGGNGAVYLVLHNDTSQADELVGASSEIAQIVELHKSEVDAQGVMRMLKQDTISLPANGKIMLQPGGYHIMLIGLKRDLRAGDTFQVVLKFKSHPDLTLQCAVRGGDMEMQSHQEHDQGSDNYDHPMITPTP